MGTKKGTSAAPAATITRYDKLVASDPSVERKGATMPYTSVSGKMFSFLSSDGVVALRLPDGEREAFLKKYRAKLAVSHDTVLVDWVAVPPSLLTKTAELKPYFRKSRAYAETLGAKRAPKR